VVSKYKLTIIPVNNSRVTFVRYYFAAIADGICKKPMIYVKLILVPSVKIIVL
jgi:hypothetical protein